MKVSINELKSMIAKIIKEEKSKTFTKSKTAKKLSLNELRGLVKNIIKEEMGGTPTIVDLMTQGLAKLYNVDKNKFAKTGGEGMPLTELPNKTINGKLVFIQNVPAAKLNLASEDLQKGFTKGSYIEGLFTEQGLNYGDLFPYKAIDPNAPQEDPLNKKSVKGTPIIPRVAANPNTRIK